MRPEPPYRYFVEQMFDPAKTGVAERNIQRWLYRQFRMMEHSSPFSARAMMSSYWMKYGEHVARETFRV